MQADRTRILALAADYDTAPTKAAKAVGRAWLLEQVAFYDADEVAGYALPSGASAGRAHADRAVRLWVAASRRAAKNPAPRLGRPPSDRAHRLDVPATAATRARIEAHAELTGKSRATVAGDALEVGAKVITGEVCDE